jgi:hypothetical protein
MPAFDPSAYAFSTIELYIGTLPIAGFKSCKYDDDLTRGDVYGTASVQIGLTQGKYKAKGTLTAYKRAYLIGLIAQLGPNFRKVPFTIVSSYGPNGFGETQTDTLPVCYIGSQNSDNSEGDEPLTNEVSLIIPQPILWNGVPSIIETFSTIAVA